MTNSTNFSDPRSPRTSPRVAVIGAGVGGLVAALELAGAGLDVTVFERGAAPGGKLRQAEVRGRDIDIGPTVFTMRWVFDDIFARAGASLDAAVSLHPAEILARHAWGPGATLDLFADVERTVEAIGTFAGAAEAAGYRAFARRSADLFRLLDRPFMRAEAPSMAKLIASVGIGRDLWSITPFTTLWRALGEHFKDPRLRQLFGRYATYCGSSPFQAPATLMLVAHAEREGVWVIEGGMHRLAQALARLACEKGAMIRYGTEVRDIDVRRGRASGLTLASGERMEVDAVVCNADVAALAGGLFGAAARRGLPPQDAGRRSLSALTFALDAATDGFPLARHTVFFSADYPREFADLSAGRLPREPTVYVCAQDRDTHPQRREGAPERLFCIVNAPARGDQHPFDAQEIASCTTNTFSLLRRCGLTIRREPGDCRVMTPSDFARLYPGTGGAIYGAASHGATASFRRAGVVSRLPGLYLCGGSIHPGPGLPMAALSGRMAAARLLGDLASTPRWRGAAMPGGISTG